MLIIKGSRVQNGLGVAGQSLDIPIFIYMTLECLYNNIINLHKVYVCKILAIDVTYVCITINCIKYSLIKFSLVYKEQKK